MTKVYGERRAKITQADKNMLEEVLAYLNEQCEDTDDAPAAKELYGKLVDFCDSGDLVITT